MLILFTLQLNFSFNRNILINNLFIIGMINYGKLVLIDLILILSYWISCNSCKSLKTRNKRIVVTCNQIGLALHLIIIIDRWSVSKLFETVQTVVVFILSNSKLGCCIHYKLRYGTVWLKVRFIVLIFFNMMGQWSVIIYSRNLWHVHLWYTIYCNIPQIYRYFLVSLSVLTLLSWLRGKTPFFINFIA